MTGAWDEQLAAKVRHVLLHLVEGRAAHGRCDDCIALAGDE
jgi:hypothetical protein